MDVVKGLMILRAQLDIYNDFLQDTDGKLSANNWQNVNQEIVVMFADFDALIEKTELSRAQNALVKMLGSGLSTGDIAELLGLNVRRIDRSIGKLCRKVTKRNNVDWLKWAYMNYIKSEWKICRVCEEQYPANEKFFHKHEDNDGGLRNDCANCFRKSKQENFSVRKVVKNTSPSTISRGANNLSIKTPKKKQKKRKTHKQNHHNLNGTGIVLPDGNKVVLPHTNNIDIRKIIVEAILDKYKDHIEQSWDGDTVKTCLDVMGYYLCKPTKENTNINILSKYKMNEMKDGSRKHITFSSLSRRQRVLLGLVDIDDDEE